MMLLNSCYSLTTTLFLDEISSMSSTVSHRRNSTVLCLLSTVLCNEDVLGDRQNGLSALAVVHRLPSLS